MLPFLVLLIWSRVQCDADESKASRPLFHRRKLRFFPPRASIAARSAREIKSGSRSTGRATSSLGFFTGKEGKAIALAGKMGASGSVELDEQPWGDWLDQADRVGKLRGELSKNGDIDGRWSTLAGKLRPSYQTRSCNPKCRFTWDALDRDDVSCHLHVEVPQRSVRASMQPPPGSTASSRGYKSSREQVAETACRKGYAISADDRSFLSITQARSFSPPRTKRASAASKTAT